MVDIHRMMLFIEAEEEERSENEDVEACETLAEMKKELKIREKKSPDETEDLLGNVYASCPNCGEHIINYLNKRVLPSYCMMCGQAIEWRKSK